MKPLILIVDDAAYTRMHMIGILSKEGYEKIIQAKDGKEAVDLYVQHRPALTILDISMPKMTGIEALKQIREINSDAKAMIISSVGQEAVVKEALNAGALDYLVKPFEPDRFAKAVKTVLGLT